MAFGDDRCMACAQPMVTGQRYLIEVNTGDPIHFDCCGPEREGFSHMDSTPLEPGEPIPTPMIWSNI